MSMLVYGIGIVLSIGHFIFYLQFVQNIDENSGKTFEWQPTKNSFFNDLLEISQYYLYFSLKFIIISEEKKSMPSFINVFHVSINTDVGIFEQFCFVLCCLIIVRGICYCSGDQGLQLQLNFCIKKVCSGNVLLH